jgi:hypothetical protein
MHRHLITLYYALTLSANAAIFTGCSALGQNTLPNAKLVIGTDIPKSKSTTATCSVSVNGVVVNATATTEVDPGHEASHGP